MGSFSDDLRTLINRYNKESTSNTPDFVLARYVEASLEAFNEATKLREKFYGISHRPGQDLIGLLVSP